MNEADALLPSRRDRRRRVWLAAPCSLLFAAAFIRAPATPAPRLDAAGANATAAAGSPPPIRVSVVQMNDLIPLSTTLVFEARRPDDRLELTNGTVTVAVKYQPVGSRLAALWSKAVVLESANGWSAQVQLLRLRPRREHRAEVYAQWSAPARNATAARLARVVHWVTRATGVPRFDEAPLAARFGSPPSWELLSLAYFASVKREERDAFEGIVVIDREGFVVWTYATHAPAAWDFLPAPDYGMVLMATADFNERVDREDDAAPGAGRVWRENGTLVRSNSMLVEVAPSGELAAQHVQACAGAPAAYNQLSHEARVERASLDVLTTTTTIRRFPELNVTTRLGTAASCDPNASSSVACARDARARVFNYAAGCAVSRWHRDDDGLELVYDLFDIVDPRDALPVTASWTALADVGCVGNSTLSPLDYHHVSSVALGLNGTLLVALRNLNTLLALDADGAGATWMLSSSIPAQSLRAGGLAANFTAFSFERDADRFFDPHSARQLEDGRVLLLDVGNDRPGCVADYEYEGCFSRAVIYALNWTTKMARLDWQFESPFPLNQAEAGWDPEVRRRAWAGAAEVRHHAMTSALPPSPPQVAYWYAQTHDFFNWDGGSVERLTSGYVQVSFTSEMPTRAANANYSMHVWEVDDRARVRSMTLIPHASDSYKGQGSYRTVPLSTLQGESADVPSEFLHTKGAAWRGVAT